MSECLSSLACNYGSLDVTYQPPPHPNERVDESQLSRRRAPTKSPVRCGPDDIDSQQRVHERIW